MHNKPTTNRYSTGMGTRGGGGARVGAPPPLMENKNCFHYMGSPFTTFSPWGGDFLHITVFLLLFSLCGCLFWSLRGVYFWACPPPYKKFCGAHEYRDRMFTLIIRAALFYSPLSIVCQLD